MGKHIMMNFDRAYIELLEARKLLSASMSLDMYPAVLIEPSVCGIAIGEPDPNAAQSDTTSTDPAIDPAIDPIVIDEPTDWSPPPIEVQYDANYSIDVHSDGTLSGEIGRFTGSAPIDQYTAVIDWGDGQTSDGAITQNADGSFSVSGDHEYADQGEFYPSAAITTGDYTAYAGKDVMMNASGMTLRWGPSVGAVQSTEPQTQWLGSFVDTSAVDASAYTVQINWGDGATSAGTIERMEDGSFQVSGDHAYAQIGSFATSYTVNKPDGTTLTASGTAEVWDGSAIEYFGGGNWDSSVVDIMPFVRGAIGELAAPIAAPTEAPVDNADVAIVDVAAADAPAVTAAKAPEAAAPANATVTIVKPEVHSFSTTRIISELDSGTSDLLA